jgi:hypothetical protein
MNYMLVVGLNNENGNHWTLVVCQYECVPTCYSASTADNLKVV